MRTATTIWLMGVTTKWDIRALPPHPCQRPTTLDLYCTFLSSFLFKSMLHLGIQISVLVDALSEINLCLQVIKWNYISIPSMNLMTEKMKGLYEQMGCGWFPQAPYVSRRWLARTYSVWATAQRVSVVHTVPYQRVEPFFNNEGMEERHTDLSSTISDLNLKYRRWGSTPCKATRICANG